MRHPEKLSKRRQLSTGFQARCAPILKGFGFRNPLKADYDRWGTTRRNAFIRWRSGFYEEVHVDWERWGAPRFRILFRTAQVERMRPPDCGPPTPRLAWVYLWAGILRLPGGRRIPLGKNFGRFMGVDRTLELAADRLRQMEVHLRNGGPSWMMDLETNRVGQGPFVGDDPTVSHPAFWWPHGDVELEPWPPDTKRPTQARRD